MLGIDLGGSNVRIGQISDGKVVKKIVEPSMAGLSLEDSLAYFKKLIRGMMTDDIEGIGIGVPSVVDIARGIVYNVANIPAWQEVPLKEILSATFNVPVFINNDSNCFVLGEKEFGIGREFKDVVGVTLGTGVGAGIIINDQLYAGKNSGAGEIGCIPYLEATLEHYCGSEFFKLHNTTGMIAAEKALEGELGLWKEFGKHIGVLMQTILFAYDPQLIIIGGGIAGAFPYFSDEMYTIMESFPYPETIKNIQIKVSRNADIGILGAGALVVNKIEMY